jgi:hypothetical protein
LVSENVETSGKGKAFPKVGAAEPQFIVERIDRTLYDNVETSGPAPRQPKDGSPNGRGWL